ncbi:MAG: PTS system mannose/fructose/sorbose family transporter subunit IID [Hungatella sp.]|nr:PTS system mannose/fructose/sorbose family transporter subunit IID [Hungatella sp.]
MSREPVLTKKDCVKGAIRWSLMAVTTFNYDTQLAPAVVFGIGPLLRKIYPDDDEYVEALNNHFKYFNTHPWAANLVFGATLALEDKEGISACDAVQNIKVSLMGPLAGIGDTLIWTLLPTIMGSIAGYMALEGNPVGVFLWLLTNLIFIGIRTQLMWVGYKEGTKLITKFGSRIAQITDAASVLGLTVVGALAATVVTAKTPLVFQMGEISMPLADLLDKILPSMISVLAVWGLYKLIGRKGMKVTTIILIVIVFSMICSALGILA